MRGRGWTWVVGTPLWGLAVWLSCWFPVASGEVVGCPLDAVGCAGIVANGYPVASCVHPGIALYGGWVKPFPFSWVICFSG
jgi:hypothetical protein